MVKLKPNRLGLFIIISVIVLSLAALISYFFIDSYVASRVFSSHKEMDIFPGAKLIKILGKSYVPLWLLFFWGFVTKRIEIILTGSLALLLALALVGPAKIISHRQRPREIYKNLLVENISPTDNPTVNDILLTRSQSFPSGDTATVFAVIIAVSPFVSSFSFFTLLILAAAVGVLRILGLVHFPSDVFAGAVFGIVSGWFALLICEKWMSENPFPFGKQWRILAVIGLILIPSLYVISHGFKEFRVFLTSSAVLACCFCMTIIIPGLWNRIVLKFLKHTSLE